jgi:hypothetical protein
MRGSAHWDGDKFVDEFDLNVRAPCHPARDSFEKITNSLHFAQLLLRTGRRRDGETEGDVSERSNHELPDECVEVSIATLHSGFESTVRF